MYDERSSLDFINEKESENTIVTGELNSCALHALKVNLVVSIDNYALVVTILNVPMGLGQKLIVRIDRSEKNKLPKFFRA